MRPLRIEPVKKSPLRPRRDAILLALFWTVAVAFSLLWGVSQTRTLALDMARAEADGAYNKEVVYRRWAARHGGLYVPATEMTPPNPHLQQFPHRDIVLEGGRTLTLVNPAYMTRQVHEMSAAEYGLRGHITSLDPIRPENAPDAWEAEALRAFARGEDSITAVQQMEGKPYMRVIHPLATESSCLKCHADQGYEVGDVRGGISVAVPLEPYLAMARHSTMGLLGGHGLIWLTGLVGLGVGSWAISRRVRERQRAEQEVEKYRDHLEELVEQRSAELKAVNEELRQRIVERRQIEVALRYERDNLSAILESMEDGAYLADEHYNLKYINPAMIREFGEPSGRKCYEYLYDRSSVCPQCPLQSVQPGDAHQWEWQSPRNGKTYDVIETTLHGPDGKLRKLEVYRDISDRKRAEAQLKAHATLLEEKNLELDEFAYMASHDLQEPLRKIISFGKLLSMDLGGDLPEKASTDLAYITDAAERMRKLVQDLLALSRAGRSAMKAEPTSLQACADRALDTMATRIEETGAVVHRDPLPEVRGDTTLLTQLYQNLISNALKFVAEGRCPEVSLVAKRRDTDWLLGVRDNGIGIDQADADKVFAAFKRLHGRSAYSGTGIGLAICRKAVTRHGGEIWIESEVGVGTTFWFTIPDALPDGPQGAEAASPEVCGTSETSG